MDECGTARALLALLCCVLAISNARSEDDAANVTDITVLTETTTLYVIDDSCNVTWDVAIGDKLDLTWSGDLDGRSPVTVNVTRNCSADPSCKEQTIIQTILFSEGAVHLNIVPNAEYRVDVDFECPLNDSSRTVLSPPRAFAVPTDVRVVRKSNTSVELAWNATNLPVGTNVTYVIEMSSSVLQGLVDTDNETITITDLVPYCNYTFRVRVEMEDGQKRVGQEKDWSEELTVQTDVGVPRAPRALSATEVGNTSATLEWLEPVPTMGPVLRYRIHWKNATKEGQTDSDCGGVNCTLGGLVPYVNYTLKVLAITAAGPGKWSDEMEVQTAVGVPHAPTGLYSASVGNTTVFLSWTPPGVSTGPILGYRVHWENASGEGQRNTPTNATFYTMNGLTPHERYAFKVLALTEAGPGTWSEGLNVTTMVGVPRAPESVHTTSVSNTTVGLMWEEPKISTGPVTGYRISWKNLTDEGELDTKTSNSSHAIGGLTPYTKYVFRVLAITDAGPGQWSEAVVVETDIGVPHAPGALRAERVGNTTVHLKWKEPDLSMGPTLMYRIHWRNSSGEGSIDKVKGTSYVVERLTPFVRYAFKVLAITEAGPGKWSNILEVQTKVGVPHAPESVHTTSVSNTTVGLKWEEPKISTGPVTGYRISWKNWTGEGELDTKTSNSSYMIRGLTPYTKYVFRVLAITDAGPGKWSEATVVQTDIGVPHAPESVHTTSVSNTTVGLKWEGPKISTGPVTGYRILWKNSTGEGELDTNSSSSSHTIGGLTPYTKYVFKVLAITDAGQGKWSEAVEVQTDIGVPHPPRALKEVKVSNTSVVLTWVEPGISTGPILTYRLQWRNSTDRGVLGDIGSASRSYEVHHLTPYENYTFQIQACTEAGPGQWSEELTIETEIGVPTAPRQLLLSMRTANSLGIIWTRPLFPHAPHLDYVIGWRLSGNPDLEDTEIAIRGDVNKETSGHAINHLLPYTNYSVRVTAVTAAGRGQATPTLLVATDIGIPRPAVIRNVVIVGERTVRVHWVTEGPYPGPVFYSLQAWKYPDPCSGNVSPTVDKEEKGSKEAKEWRGELSTPVGGLSPFGNYSFALLLSTAATDGVESRKSNIVQMPPEASSEPRNVTSECHWSPTRARVSWDPPLTPNGRITSYRIWYGVESASDIKSAIVYVSDVCSNQSHVISRMRPERRYIITVTATVDGVMEDGKAGYAKGLCILPAGIPYLGDTSRLRAKSSAASDHVILEWTEDTFSDYMGAILHYAVLVGKQGALGGSLGGKVADKPPTWSNFNTGSSDYYQATPFDWNPFAPGKTDPLHCEVFHIQEENNRTLLRCTIGRQSPCPDNETFCNGPLEPETTYEIKIRGFTRGGYNETQLLSVQTSPVPKNSVAGPVAAVVIILLLLGSLAGGYFVLKRKGLLGAIRVRTGFRKEAPASVEEGVEMQKGRTSRCVKAKHFAEHVRQMMSDSHLQFSQEFEALKNESPQLPCTIAESDENRLKNRWMNIFPFDHSRVKLLPLCDEPGSDFINANYIPGLSSPREYIATQGPLPHTLEDFWRMVWEQSVTTIVMLTQCVERGKKKCEQYWPKTGEAQYYGDLIVATISESMLSTFVIRILHLQLGSYERQVKQMHFTRWPDFGCPESPEDLINFVGAVRDHLPRTAPGPILVHCSAGVGRTGTFIAVDRLIRQLRSAAHPGEDTVDIYGTVLELRNHRTNMVQTEDQYIYIHLCVNQLIWERDRPYPSKEDIYANVGIEKDTSL